MAAEHLTIGASALEWEPGEQDSILGSDTEQGKNPFPPLFPLSLFACLGYLRQGLSLNLA